MKVIVKNNTDKIIKNLDDSDDIIDALEDLNIEKDNIDEVVIKIYSDDC